MGLTLGNLYVWLGGIDEVLKDRLSQKTQYVWKVAREHSLRDNNKLEGSKQNSLESFKNRNNATLAEVCTLYMYVSI